MHAATFPSAADLAREVASLPSAAAAIVALTVDPDCPVGELEAAIAADAAMTLRLLAVANGAAFSRGRPVGDVKTAVVRLGLRRVRNIALLMATHDMLPGDALPTGFDAAGYRRFNLAVAAAGQALARLGRSSVPEDAWLTGLLHGVGVTVLARREPDALAHALALARAESLGLDACVRRLMGFGPAEVAAQLIRAWHLPPHLADALAPGANPSPDAARLAANLDAATAVVRASGFGDGGDQDPAPTPDEAAQRAGLPPDAWDELAAAITADLDASARFLGADLGAGGFADALASARTELARLGLEGVDETIAREELEQQLALARRIQQRLLPQDLAGPRGWCVAAVNRAADHVSGDTYDLVPLPGGATGLAIADVAGKGLPAALLATSLQATLRALGAILADPGALLTAANTALAAATEDEHFATVFLAALDPGGRRLRYASAGHLPPLLLRADGQAVWLMPAGLPLGLASGTTYPVRDVAIAPGDLLVAVTDGVTEAGQGQGCTFGRAGLEAAVRGVHGRDPRAVADAVAAAASAAAGGVPDDDLTVLVLAPRP